MKQIILVALLLLTLGVFSSCKGRPAPVLPEPASVTAAEVTMDEESLTHLKRAWIEEVIAGLSAAAPTRTESVSDAPSASDYTLLELCTDDGACRMFFYEKDGAYYMEQPYQGIWQIDQQLYATICSTP